MTTTAQLDALIDELTLDAYDDDEQLSGFLTGAEEAPRRGEPAQIVGIDVEVLEIDAGPDVRTGLATRVRRDGVTYEVGLADLAFPVDSQQGRSGRLPALAGPGAVRANPSSWPSARRRTGIRCPWLRVLSGVAVPWFAGAAASR